MAGALVASQFLAAQNWALGSAMAVVLIFTILASIAIAAVVALVVRTVMRKARAIDVAPPVPLGTRAGALT
jgi:spermidine/putrescine transport system permease protein